MENGERRGEEKTCQIGSILFASVFTMRRREGFSLSYLMTSSP